MKNINVSYTFNLNQLPVSFGQSLQMSGDNILNLTPLSQAIGQIIEAIHEVGGFKFRQSHIQKDPKIIYYYYCSQDSSRWLKSVGTGRRDRHQIERFDCKSLLRLSPELSDRRLSVVLIHNHHEKYVNIRLS